MGDEREFPHSGTVTRRVLGSCAAARNGGRARAEAKRPSRGADSEPANRQSKEELRLSEANYAALPARDSRCMR